MFRTLFYILVVLLGFSACGSKKKVLVKSDELSTVIDMLGDRVTMTRYMEKYCGMSKRSAAKFREGS